MPSEFNHIDDFIRGKENESMPDTTGLDKHWQQMRELLTSPPSTPAKIGTWSKWRWQLPAGIVILALGAFMVFKNQSPSPAAHSLAVETPAHTIQTEPSVQNKEQDIPASPGTAGSDSIQKKTIPAVIAGTTPSPTKKFKTEKKILPDTARPNPLSQKINLEKTKDFPDSTRVVLHEDPAQQLTRFFERLQKPAQQFTINNQQDTLLRCAEGTLVFVPAHSFRNYENVSIENNVRISVNEFYQLSDIIARKLTTLSGNQPLVTGGMLHIEASAEGRPLLLQNNKAIGITMPTNRFDPQMQLFLGQNNSIAFTSVNNHQDTVAPFLSSTGINWLPAGQLQSARWNAFDDRKMVTVLDLANDPRSVTREGNKIVARFILSEDSRMTIEQAKKELQKRYGSLYDEIRVRRGWKETYMMERYQLNGIPQPGLNGLIGDSIQVSLRVASLANLISREDSLKYEAQFKKQFEVYTGSAYADYAALQHNYSFTVSGMGWINCDKFLAMRPSSLTDLVFDPGAAFSRTYFQSFLIFHQMNSILPGSWSNGKILFRNIPEQQQVTMVCVGIKDGKAFCSIKEMVVTKNGNGELTPVETDPQTFREMLGRFGSVKG